MSSSNLTDEEMLAGYLPQDPKFATRAIHTGQSADKWNSKAVIPPITLSTTFKQYGPGQFEKYEYSRGGNPTRDTLEECLAALEQAKYCISFASGLAATTSVIHLLSSGDHILAMDDLYGGTNRYFQKIVRRMQVQVDFVDARDPENVRKAMKPNTKLVWLESPTNPTLKMVDIKKVSDIAHSQPDVIVLVDNTFLTPYFQKPLLLGADMCLHSLTKYLNGHSDVLMGAVMMSDPKLHERLRFIQFAMGCVPSPFECYLANRGVKTLHVRMKEHMRNALFVAKFLESHPLVESVLHPGLPSHPQHELAKRQTQGHSGMCSFYLKGGLKESEKFLKALKLFTLAESLGGYESLAELPSVMTHASVPPEERKVLKITDNLIRLSIGLEEPEDLVEDLDQALKAAISG